MNLTEQEKIRTCLEVLKAIEADRTLLEKLEQQSRLDLLMTAGRLSRPERNDLRAQARARRKLKKQKNISEDRALKADTQIRQARMPQTYLAPEAMALPKEGRGHLHRPQACYVCKTKYTEIHFFYDSMCKDCGDLNYRKRFESADLRGRVALVTGGRVKIGFQTALKLLRAGAHVVVTSRFPNDAAHRFSLEKDFPEWSSRLEIFGLDLRHSPSVEVFARYLHQHLPHLDILINNAAQTVRRPPGFYRDLVPNEEAPISTLPPIIQPLVRAYSQCRGQMGSSELTERGNWLQLQKSDTHIGLTHPSALSLVPYDHKDIENEEVLFPVGKLDADLQQVDMRNHNTWRMTLSEVSTGEMLEVHLINAVAPFILCGGLKNLMEKSPFPDRYIVNASAMEGKFTRFTKTDKHPHTNMAKAALNMMTMTSAPDYLKSGIYLNAVDTGWVTDEDPIQHATRKIEELDFQPPLDIVDGAARLCDPVIQTVNGNPPIWGKFLKDYFSTTW